MAENPKVTVDVKVGESLTLLYAMAKALKVALEGLNEIELGGDEIMGATEGSRAAITLAEMRAILDDAGVGRADHEESPDDRA